MFPLNIPLSLQGTFVLYIGTFLPSSMCLTPNPNLINDSSKEKLQPIKNPTKSACHKSLISFLYSTNLPSLYILYDGKSVLKSAPFEQNFGHSYPSVISSNGHGFGFNSQNLLKSSAYFLGIITKFACTYPGH
jgi:hypothetical protein